MKLTPLSILMIWLWGCQANDVAPPAPTGLDIITKSQAYHDPHNTWKDQKIDLHIAEPRIRNPLRYSIISLDNATGAFSLQRNRDQHIVEYTIDTDGRAQIKLDGEEDVPPQLTERYRLDPDRNELYRGFYERLIGLPMSLDDSFLEQIVNVDLTSYEERPAYKVSVELKEELFSKHWYLYFDQSTYEVLGIEIIHPDDETKGERLYFDGAVTLGDITIPRVRHWHEYSDDSYSGSDIIITSSADRD